MKKHFFFAKLFIESFLPRYKKHILFGIFSGFLFTLFFIQFYPFYIKFLNKKNYRIGIVGKYSRKNLPLSIQNQISLGLTALMPDGVATASLATSWEINNQGKEYIFHIPDNLIWHDGKKFSTKDLTDYQLKGATFSAINDQVLKVNLHEAYAPFLTILSQPKIRPNLIGLGPYKVNRIFTSDDIIDKLDLKPLINNLPFLTYKFYPTISAAILGFKLGEVDKLENIADIQDLRFERNIKISEITLYDRYVAIFLNLKDPLFKEKEIRQALNYALPKFEGFEKTYTPISPLSWAYSQKIRLYNSDPETAKKILSKSYISSSTAQLTVSTFAPLLDKAQIITDAWNKIGLSVKTKVENSFPADYQLLLLTQIIPPDPDQYQYWQSTQENTNITHYNNPKIDKLLEDGRITMDINLRKKIYADFQRYLVDDAPVLFLYYPKVYTVERSSKM